MEKLVKEDYNVIPIMSQNAYSTDTRFGTAQEFIDRIENITDKKVLHTITDTEPIGPKKMCDLLVVAPCTGNTAAKLWNGLTDTPVLMAAKAHMRNQKPLVIAIATNDAMGLNFKSIGNLMSAKNIFFVPFGQDNCKGKPNSLVADFTQIPETILLALEGKQIQPVLLPAE